MEVRMNEPADGFRQVIDIALLHEVIDLDPHRLHLPLSRGME
jgi:hypothetical protein